MAKANSKQVKQAAAEVQHLFDKAAEALLAYFIAEEKLDELSPQPEYAKPRFAMNLDTGHSIVRLIARDRLAITLRPAIPQ